MKRKPKKKAVKKKRITRKDENLMAFDVIAKIAGPGQKEENEMTTDAISQIMKAMGKKGGMARKAKLSSERLSEIGREAAMKRWHTVEQKTVVPPHQAE